MDEHHIIPRNPDGSAIELLPSYSPRVGETQGDPSRPIGYAIVLALAGGVAGYLVRHEEGAAVGAVIGAIAGIAYGNFSTT